MWYIIHYNDEYGDAAVVNIVNACSTPKKEEQEMLEKVPQFLTHRPSPRCCILAS